MIQTFPRYFNIGASVEIKNLSNNTSLIVNNKTGNGLRIVWECKRTNASNADTATVTIYNLSESNIGKLETVQSLLGSNFSATLGFGWDNQVFELLSGQIFTLTTQERTPTDVITTFSFGENIINQRDALPPNLEVVDGLWLTGFEVLAGELGATLSQQFLTALENNPVVLGLGTFSAVLGDDVIADLDVLVESMGPGYDWIIKDGEMFLLNGGLFQDTTPPQILSPNTGLLEYTPQEGGGLQIRALGHPGINPGQQLLVQDKNGKQIGGGPLRVEEISWTGDTNVGCEMTIVARNSEIAQFV